jgi:hypothetical protein
MESFYSIIYYRPNNFTDELLSIGLLASGGEGPFIHISKRRLHLLYKTLHSSQFISIKRHLKYLSKSVNEDRRAPNELLLFDPNFARDRLEEISRKTKRGVLYGQPVTINEWLNSSFFQELVQSFLGDSINETAKKRPVFHLKWKAYYHSNRCANWERDVPISSLKSTVLPLKIDLLSSKSKSLIKAVDFDLKPETVRKKLHEIYLIADLFDDYDLTIVHPGTRKNSGKELLKSTKSTVKNISVIKFSEFKQIS